MKEVKTIELIGPALDWAVAKAGGHEPIVTPFKNSKGNALYLAEWARLEGIRWQPSTDWSQGGPIVEREGIAIDYDHDVWNAAKYGLHWYVSGPTPLVAAMRCLVAAKLGDTVRVPEELL